MWHTPLGLRNLRGSEADLFKCAAGIYQSILLDMVSEGENLDGTLVAPDVNRWERIPWHQQVCAIGEVAKHILDYADDPAPQLAAWNEITIYKVYEFLIDSDDVESFGKYVVRAAFETGLVAKKCKPTVKSFKRLLSQLRDRVLHLRDFDASDVERVRANGLKALGMRDGYFAALFPTFTMERFLASLVLLNEDRAESASALLPHHCRSRFERSLDTVPADPLDWFPPPLID